jgi:hypothetical protein
MSQSPLWMSIEPMIVETRLMLSVPGVGTALRARLPLLVVDAEAEDVCRHPERWSLLLGELDGEQIRVEWVWSSSRSARDRFLGAVGDFHRARRLITFAATGQR